eukprot:symbB.v1.2.037679.t1/scaffold5631.1/size25152/4
MPATKKQKTWESIRLEDHIGLALDGAPPRSAVRQFFDRYTGLRSSKDDFYFSHKHMEEGVVATLIAPALGDRHFEGQQCSNEKSAEQSAAAVFVQDPEVLQTARCLPPPLATLRKIADRYHSKKQQLAAKGLSTKEAAEEILRDIYENLRDRGDFPHFLWSSDGKYFAQCNESAAISVRETEGKKKTMKFPDLSTFQWSPKENLLSVWCLEQENNTARLFLVEIPSRCELASRSRAQVEASMHWQSEGDYLSNKSGDFQDQREEHFQWISWRPLGESFQCVASSIHVPC